MYHTLTWVSDTAAKEKAALWKLMQKLLYPLQITGRHFFAPFVLLIETKIS